MNHQARFDDVTPDQWFQSLGKGATLDLSTRLWSMDGSARATWLKNLRRVVRMTCVSGGWSVGQSRFHVPKLSNIGSISSYIKYNQRCIISSKTGMSAITCKSKANFKLF